MSARPRLRSAVRRVILALIGVSALAAVWLPITAAAISSTDPLQKSTPSSCWRTCLERPFEAVDLYKEGYAPLIVLSPGRPEAGEALLRQRGIRFPSEVELERDALVQLGIPAAAILATNGYLDNTAQEANLLRSMVVTHQWRRVIIVTSKYHTRRAAFAFRRGLDGTGAEVVMRASRYDASDPARWWRYRSDFRFASSEWQKLIAYRLGLGG